MADRIVGTLGDDTPGLCTGRVLRIEFLGGNCLAEVDVDGLPGQPLQLQYSLCLLYTSPSPRDLSTSRMPSSA